jgi:hypothetical protein
MARGSIWGVGVGLIWPGEVAPGWGEGGGHGGVHACPGEVRPGDLVDLPYWPVDRDTWDVARGD